MSKTFFAADLHLGHKNILRYEPSRLKAVYERYPKYQVDSFEDFQKSVYKALDDIKAGTVSEFMSDFFRQVLTDHDNMLVDNWNSVVSNDDVVWFLGDLALNGKVAAKYATKLNGRKNLIIGNHDSGSAKFYKDLGFINVYRVPIVLKQKFILAHAPLEELLDKGPLIQIYGHVHSNNNYKTKTEFSQCVSIERQNLMPIEIPEFDAVDTPDMTMNSKV